MCFHIAQDTHYFFHSSLLFQCKVMQQIRASVFGYILKRIAIDFLISASSSPEPFAIWTDRFLGHRCVAISH